MGDNGQRRDAAIAKATAIRQRAFLAAFAVTGVVTEAASAAGIDRRIHSRWMKASDEYRQAFDDASAMATDYLETEAVRMATTGWLETAVEKTTENGIVTKTVKKVSRKRSPVMLMFLLKARDRRFNDRLDVHAQVIGHIDVRIGKPRDAPETTYADLLAERRPPAVDGTIIDVDKDGNGREG